jgi:hypothetical protein
VLDVTDLPSYVSAAESTHSTDPSLLEAQTMVNRLRRTADQLLSGGLPVTEVATTFRAVVSRLSEVALRFTSRGQALSRTVQQLEEAAREFTKMDAGSVALSGAVRTWTDRITPLLNSLDTDLRGLRRQTNVGAYS